MRTFVSILVVAFVMSLSLTAATDNTTARQKFNPEQNHPSYWGENCVKFEGFGNNVYSYSSSSDDTSKVIIKGGPANVAYSDGSFENLDAPSNPNSGKLYAISHVIECYDADDNQNDDHEDEKEDDHEDEPRDDHEDKNDEKDHKVWICHWTEGVNGFIKLNVAVQGADNGHLGEHHHHDKDFVVSAEEACETEKHEPNCENDEIYYQQNLDICEPDEDEPQDDEPEVLGDTDDKGKGGGEVLAETGSETVIASTLATGAIASALAAIRMSKPSKEEMLSAISL